MAKSKTPPPPAPKGFASMSFGRKVLIFFVLLLVISFILNALGVPIVHRSEDTEMLDHPHR